MLRARSQKAKDQRRNVLLAAAMDEFFERGFSAARMEDIAKRAKLSKGAVYLYFKSKEDLFTALVETYAVPNIARVAAVAASAPDAPAAIHALLNLAPVIIRETPVPKIVKILVSDASAFPNIVTDYRKNIIERGLGVIEDVLHKANADGVLAVPSPALTARLIVAPMVMSMLWHVVFERNDPDAEVDLESLLSLHGGMLMRALTPEAEEAA